MPSQFRRKYDQVKVRNTCSGGGIGAVRTANARYLNLRPEAPFVGAIAIELVGKDSTNLLA